MSRTSSPPTSRRVAGHESREASSLAWATEEEPVRDKFLVFGAPLIEEAEIDEVVASLRSGWLGTGPKVARFERDFAR